MTVDWSGGFNHVSCLQCYLIAQCFFACAKKTSYWFTKKQYPLSDEPMFVGWPYLYANPGIILPNLQTFHSLNSKQDTGRQVGLSYLERYFWNQKIKFVFCKANHFFWNIQNWPWSFGNTFPTMLSRLSSVTWRLHMRRDGLNNHVPNMMIWSKNSSVLSNNNKNKKPKYLFSLKVVIYLCGP